MIDILSEQVSPGRQIRLDDHLEIDLGLDSLGRVELMAACEKILKINISESSMAKIFTVREFILEAEKMILKGEEKGRCG